MDTGHDVGSGKAGTGVYVGIETLNAGQILKGFSR